MRPNSQQRLRDSARKIPPFFGLIPTSLALLCHTSGCSIRTAGWTRRSPRAGLQCLGCSPSPSTPGHGPQCTWTRTRAGGAEAIPHAGVDQPAPGRGRAWSRCRPQSWRGSAGSLQWFISGRVRFFKCLRFFWVYWRETHFCRHSIYTIILLFKVNSIILKGCTAGAAGWPSEKLLKFGKVNNCEVPLAESGGLLVSGLIIYQSDCSVITLVRRTFTVAS